MSKTLFVYTGIVLLVATLVSRDVDFRLFDRELDDINEKYDTK